LELRKISYEIDTILGIQMTIKMACYFCWITFDLCEILYSILINNYVKYRIMCITVYLIWVFHNFCKFLLINYMCEIVTNKVIILYSTKKKSI